MSSSGTLATDISSVCVYLSGSAAFAILATLGTDI